MRVILSVAAVVAASGLVSGCGSGPSPPQAAASSPAQAPLSAPRLTVRKRVLGFVDRRRTVSLSDGETLPREFPVVVRYPEFLGGRLRARRPLVVFAHGFALFPGSYRTLLYAWARAGYVVAAPAFPGEVASAPGGPTRADVLNEPGDIRFLIRRLIAAGRRRSGPLSGRIDPARIVVAGHSDGGDAALAAAFDPRYRIRGVDGAIILAGADLPGIPPFAFPAHGPPLLAVQGSADRVNPPWATDAYYRRARAPKLLLTLLGAGHYDPYMSRRSQLRIVTRATIAFLDRVVGPPGTTWGDVVRSARARGRTRLQVALR